MRTEAEMNSDVQGLWKAVFGEPPSVDAPRGMLLDVLISHLPPAPFATIGPNGIIATSQKD